MALPELFGLQKNDSVLAWCTFDGEAVDITATMTGENVASIDDDGTGYFTPNFVSSLGRTDYVVVGSGKIKTAFADNNHGTVGIKRNTTPGLLSCSLGFATASGSTSDIGICGVAFIG